MLPLLHGIQEQDSNLIINWRDFDLDKEILAHRFNRMLDRTAELFLNESLNIMSCFIGI